MKPNALMRATMQSKPRRSAWIILLVCAIAGIIVCVYYSAIIAQYVVPFIILFGIGIGVIISSWRG